MYSAGLKFSRLEHAPRGNWLRNFHSLELTIVRNNCSLELSLPNTFIPSWSMSSVSGFAISVLNLVFYLTILFALSSVVLMLSCKCFSIVLLR